MANNLNRNGQDAPPRARPTPEQLLAVERLHLAQAAACIAQLQVRMEQMQRCIDAHERGRETAGLSIGATLYETLTQTDAQLTLLRAQVMLLMEQSEAPTPAFLPVH